MQGLNEVEVLIPEEEIQKKVSEIAARINRDYKGRNPLLVGVLRGAVFFLTDLARRINLPVKIDFIAVSSYGSTTESSGIVKITKDLEFSLEGEDVILVEDIIDTGLTVKYLLELFEARKPASLKVCSLLLKPARLKVQVPIDYLGFEVPNRFIVGYGLDYDQKYRNLPFIGYLKDK